MGVSFYYIVTRALDLITVILPPALPATLSVGLSSAIERLKTEKIFCVAPSKYILLLSYRFFNFRINVGSKVDRVCFDKTGTLTEDGLKIGGVIIFDLNDTPRNVLSAKDLSSLKPALFQLMATCHNLRLFADRLVGDPLDVEMFSFTGLAISNGPSKTQIDVPVFINDVEKV
jgi:cation-transporting ATPase 13A3/4/5